jgi:hypothetical protein
MRGPEHQSSPAEQREAADAWGVSPTTIRRRREAGDVAGAVQDEQRGWLIPAEDLLAAGFRLNAPALPDKEMLEERDEKPGQEEATAGATPPGPASARWSSWRRSSTVSATKHALQLAEERTDRAVAETEAHNLQERLRERAEHIADLQKAPQHGKGWPPARGRPHTGPGRTPGHRCREQRPGPATPRRRRWWSRRG